MTLNIGLYDPLQDPYPEEFADITVGTAINADTAQLLAGAEAFDKEALEREKLLIYTNYADNSERYVDGTDTESQNLWGWDASASVKLDLGIVGASAKFFVQQSLSSCRRSSQMRAFAWDLHSRDVKLKGTRQQLLACRQQLLACRTTPFAEKMDAVVDAAKKLDKNDGASVKALERALIAFYDTYGTGFVHTVHDMAIGIFEGTMHSDSATDENNFLIGGGASVSVLFASAGAAAQYFNKLKTTTNAKHFSARASGRPTDCAPAAWAQELADNFNKIGIDQCTAEKAWDPAFSTPPVVQEPEHEPKDPPTPTTTPAAATLLTARSFQAAEAAADDVDTGAIASAIHSGIQRIRLDRLDPAYKAQPDPFKAELDELRRQAGLSAEAINSQAATPLTPEELSLQAEPNGTDGKGDNAGGNGDTYPAESARSGVLAGAQAFAESAPDETPKYAPRGYEYKEWSFLFPELGEIQKLCSTAQVVFGQAMVWFSIRSVFAQYLDFCAQYKDMVGPGIVAAAGQFRAALNKVGDVLTNSLSDADTDDKLRVDLKFLQRLEARLKQELLVDSNSPNRFRMYEHYEFWIRNYSWLKQIPFGVVAFAELKETDATTGAQTRTYYYQENPYPHCPLLDKQTVKTVNPGDEFPSPAELMARNAYRLYPIISTDSKGDPYFVWVGPPSRLEGTWADADRRFCEKLTLTELLKLPGNHGDFKETTLPALIHQSADNAQMIADAEHNGQLQRYLKERWDNRQAMWGMNRYPAFDSGTEPEDPGLQRYPLLQLAGQLAKAASRVGTALPDTAGESENGWPLCKPADGEAPKAAYFRKYDAIFFWGPGPEGWDLDLFEPCDIRLVPINYDAVEWGSDQTRVVRSGGRPMWMQPRTDDLVADLGALAHKPGY